MDGKMISVKILAILVLSLSVSGCLVIPSLCLVNCTTVEQQPPEKDQKKETQP